MENKKIRLFVWWQSFWRRSKLCGVREICSAGALSAVGKKETNCLARSHYFLQWALTEPLWAQFKQLLKRHSAWTPGAARLSLQCIAASPGSCLSPRGATGAHTRAHSYKHEATIQTRLAMRDPIQERDFHNSTHAICFSGYFTAEYFLICPVRLLSFSPNISQRYTEL